MKKLKLITLAVAGLAIISCAKMETPAVTMESSDQLITFATPVVGPQTKAHNAINGTTFPTTESFKVAAKWSAAGFIFWSDATDFMSLQNATYQGVNVGEGGTHNANGSWSTANAYYWPKQGFLTFIAYSPASVNGTITNDGIKFENYVAAVDGSQVDLLYSGFIKDQEKASHIYGTTYDGVQIPFNHALSQLVFNLSTDKTYSNVEIKVQSITVKNIKNNGTFDNATWTPSGTAVDYNVISSGDVTVTNSVTKSTDAANMNDVLIIPQAFTDDIKIDITYTINQNNEGAIDQTFSQKVNALTYYSDAARTTSVATTGYEKGKKYIYNIVFTLDQIFFSPEVIDWVPIYSSDLYPYE